MNSATVADAARRTLGPAGAGNADLAAGTGDPEHLAPAVPQVA